MAVCLLAEDNAFTDVPHASDTSQEIPPFLLIHCEFRGESTPKSNFSSGFGCQNKLRFCFSPVIGPDCPQALTRRWISCLCLINFSSAPTGWISPQLIGVSFCSLDRRTRRVRRQRWRNCAVRIGIRSMPLCDGKAMVPRMRRI